LWVNHLEAIAIEGLLLQTGPVPSFVPTQP
jgi:hypothetical protein